MTELKKDRDSSDGKQLSRSLRLWQFSCFTEVFLSYTAGGAHPVFGQVFKSGTGRNVVLGIAYCGVVLIAADVANVLLHDVFVFSVLIIICFTGSKTIGLYSL